MGLGEKLINIAIRLSPSTFKEPIKYRISQMVRNQCLATHKRLEDSQPEKLQLLKKVEDLEIELKQLESILQREKSISLPPPKHLQIRVVGGMSQASLKAALLPTNS